MASSFLECRQADRLQKDINFYTTVPSVSSDLLHSVIGATMPLTISESVSSAKWSFGLRLKKLNQPSIWPVSYTWTSICAHSLAVP
jgi:hypothetical protein